MVFPELFVFFTASVIVPVANTVGVTSAIAVTVPPSGISRYEAQVLFAVSLIGTRIERVRCAVFSVSTTVCTALVMRSSSG